MVMRRPAACPAQSQGGVARAGVGEEDSLGLALVIVNYF